MPAVLVEVHDRDVIRIRDLRDGHRSRLRMVRPRLEHDALAHVAGQELEAAVAVEIGEADVRHRRLGRERVLERDRPPHEPQGPVVRSRPHRKGRQRGRRGRFVIGDDGLVLFGQRHRGRGAASLRRPFAGHDRRHLLDLGPPGRARQDVRVRHLVAGDAEGLGQAWPFVGGGRGRGREQAGIGGGGTRARRRARRRDASPIRNRCEEVIGPRSRV